MKTGKKVYKEFIKYNGSIWMEKYPINYREDISIPTKADSAPLELITKIGDIIIIAKSYIYKKINRMKRFWKRSNLFNCSYLKSM